MCMCFCVCLWLFLPSILHFPSAPLFLFQDRYIVVREIDGTLRQAHWEERDRMNQIYFPKEGRHLTLPKMLTSAHLPDVLQGESVHRHEEVLDLCNLQCEPDSPDYIRVGTCSALALHPTFIIMVDVCKPSLWQCCGTGS